MIRLRYNTKLNTKPKLWIYTPWELFIGAMISIAPVFLTIILGMDPNPLDAILTFIIYTVFLMLFKVGKPEGYLSHLISHKLTPSEFRPGVKEAEFPIMPENALEEELRLSNMDTLKKDILGLQRLLVENGYIPLDLYGNYLIVDINSLEAQELIAENKKIIDSGKILIWEE